MSVYAESVDAYSSRMSPSPPPDRLTILDERRNRKQLEEDAMRLRNRVRTLQKEEERVNKQISNTESRIARAERVKEEKAQRQMEKHIRQEREQHHLLLRREKNAKSRIESKKTREDNEVRLQNEKLHLARESKEEKLQHKRRFFEDQNQDLKTAQQKTEGIKRIESDIKRKLKLHQDSKLTKAHEDYERRREEERQARLMKESELEELMRMELELIEKLKMKQKEQENQYRRLKECIGGRMRDGSGKATLPSLPPIVKRGVFEDSGIELDEKHKADIIHCLDPEEQGCIPHGRFLSWWNGHKARSLLVRQRTKEGI